MRRTNSNALRSLAAVETESKMDFPKLQPRAGFLPPHKTQLPPRLFSSGNSSAKQGRGNWWAIVGILIALCALFYLLSVVRGYKFSARFQKFGGYGVVIDAGSTGSRIHVFEYVNEGGIPLVKGGAPSLKTKPGLSAFASTPEQAGESLVELLEFSRKKVPESRRHGTKVFLMATAGLRRLDSDTQEKILESCRRVLRFSGFNFKDDWASVITGPDEGLFAWVAANYALGTLGGNPHKTTGIIELGGASAQVTFVPEEPPPPEFLQTLTLGGITYKLYSHSLLHFGQEAAWESLSHMILSGAFKSSLLSAEKGVVLDPCTPKGYTMDSEELLQLPGGSANEDNGKLFAVHSNGNFSKCRNAALALLQEGQDECVYQHCKIGSTFIPEFRGKFFATENFFYTSQFFGLVPKASLSDIEKAGQHFCGEDWAVLQEKHHNVEKEELLKYCFSSAYIVALLNDSLGIAMNDERIRFTNQVGTVPIDWALGAFILRMMEDLPLDQPSWILGEDSLTGFSLIAILVLLGLAAWSLSRWRKPHVKTIYDLEKGRYITTAARVYK
uniref:TSA: Wollemia nobilis Ref_Wollemi_Transcript_28575_2165 transcribed RNA sequence n=1 Tax=Wollemia nobilis TaxID=56998 RepID=A0A0C9QL94_9CONI